MDKVFIIAFSIICVFLVLACMAGVIVLLPGEEAISIIASLVEADQAAAQADRAAARAELTIAQAELEHATGERILKEAEGNAIESSVNTANRLVTFWGISFPLVIPISAFTGMVLGGVAAGSAAYVLGYKAGLKIDLNETRVVEPSEPQIAIPEVTGG